MANNTGLTKILTNTTFTITEEMGIRSLSLSLISGTVTYIWNKPIGGLTPDAITMVAGEYPNVYSQKPIGGFVITAPAGSVKCIFSE